ncbi:MAG: molybdopterin-dependent oxidoreductase [Chloroflexota bacterium]|nr:molybdopterin-dependent oxidoreductase [Chloroflexota bacterium]
MALTRRQLLKYSGLGFLGAVVFAGCRIPEQEFIAESPVMIPEDLVRGDDAYYATLARPSTGVESVLVRVMQGRAKKIEGNPDYPMSRGKHSAQAEATLQELYHPDRIATPLRRVGERGSGEFESISWSAALDELARRLEDHRGVPDAVAIVTEPLRGALGTIVDRFAENYGARRYSFEAVDQTVVRTVFNRMYGQERLPTFDIQNAHYVLSFGADFLSHWHAPLHYNWHYGEFRGETGGRGKLVQIEPRFSLTAANADKWVYINPGTEGILALAIAKAILDSGEGVEDAGLAAFINNNAQDAATVADLTGVKSDLIETLAHDFAANQPGVAIGGGLAAAQTNGLFNMTAVYALNALVGNVGKKGGVIFNPPAPVPNVVSSASANSLTDFQRLADDIRHGAVTAVLVHGVDPAHGTPGSMQFGRALRENAEFVASFSNFMDETTLQADLVLPDMASLESWGSDVPDPGPGYEAVALQQPVVMPFVEGRSFGDVLLALVEELGGSMTRQMPWDTMEAANRSLAQEIWIKNRGSVRSFDSFEEFWVAILQRGGWWDTNATGGEPQAPDVSQDPGTAFPSFTGAAGDYPFHLLPFPSHSMGDGTDAHLPWLQATPDPITTAVWSTWVEVNPRDAESMDVREGDVVTVESPQGSIEAQVYVNPATAPGTVSVPMGQGHSSFGRYAEGVGSNVMEVLDAISDETTGAFAWGATRVRLAKTGRRERVRKFEGMVVAQTLPHRPVYVISTGNGNGGAH